MRNDKFRSALEDSYVPPLLAPRLLNWVENGVVDPGDRFTLALITNNLLLAVSYGVETELAYLQDICSTLRNHAPKGAFFSIKASWNWPMFLRADREATAAKEAYDAQAVLKSLAEAQLKDLLHGS